MYRMLFLTGFPSDGWKFQSVVFLLTVLGVLKSSGRQNRGNIFFPSSPLLFLTSPLHVLMHIMICLQAGDEETSLSERELNGVIKSSRWCGLTVSGSFVRRAETTLVIRICIIMTG